MMGGAAMGVSIRVEGDALYFVASVPCGNRWAGMVNSDDLPIQVRKALKHVNECERCRGRVGGAEGQPTRERNTHDTAEHRDH